MDVRVNETRRDDQVAEVVQLVAAIVGVVRQDAKDRAVGDMDRCLGNAFRKYDPRTADDQTLHHRGRRGNGGKDL